MTSVYGNEKDKDTRQARYINFEEKIHSTSTAISFNKMCITYHLKPKFVIAVTVLIKWCSQDECVLVGFIRNTKE